MIGKDIHRLKVKGWEKSYHSHGPRKQAEVAIHISNEINFKPNCCVISGAHCLPLLQPFGGSFLSTLTHFLFHRGLFGWWPHTPRMLLRDEARHGARCSRKPEKGFSSL
uniref:Uncharacterized protein n=1 Tax=Spermophilus dauricus TaxID=99837 RepID=A0A8C9QEE4_SPEDA